LIFVAIVVLTWQKSHSHNFDFDDILYVDNISQDL